MATNASTRNRGPRARGGKSAPAAPPVADPTLVGADEAPADDEAPVTDPTLVAAPDADEAPATDEGGADEGEGEGEGEAPAAAPATNGRKSANRVAPVALAVIIGLYRAAIAAATAATRAAAAADSIDPNDAPTVIDAPTLATLVGALRTHTGTRANVMRDASAAITREIQQSRDIVASWAASAVQLAAVDALATAANPGKSIDHGAVAAAMAMHHADLTNAATRVMGEFLAYCQTNAVDIGAAVESAATDLAARSAAATSAAIDKLANLPSRERENRPMDWAAVAGTCVTYTDPNEVTYSGTVTASGGIVCDEATSARFIVDGIGYGAGREDTKHTVDANGRVVFAKLSRAIRELRPASDSGNPYSISGPGNFIVCEGHPRAGDPIGTVAADAYAAAHEGDDEAPADDDEGDEAPATAAAA